MSPVSGMSVRELVLELTRLVDALRRTPALNALGDGTGTAVNPDFVALAARERQVITALRGVRAEWRAERDR